MCSRPRTWPSTAFSSSASFCATMRSQSSASSRSRRLRSSSAGSPRTLASSACFADSGSTSPRCRPSWRAVPSWIRRMAFCTKRSPERSSQSTSILFSTANRLLWPSSRSGWMYFCQISMSEAVTPASADSRNRIAWALGSIDRVSSGSLPRAFRPGVSRIRRPWRSSGWSKLTRAWRQAGTRTWSGSSAASRASGWKPSWIACSTGSALVLATWAKAWAMPSGSPVSSGMFTQWRGTRLNWATLASARRVSIGSRRM